MGRPKTKGGTNNRKTLWKINPNLNTGNSEAFVTCGTLKAGIATNQI